jgi:hypothetical protein
VARPGWTSTATARPSTTWWPCAAWCATRPACSPTPTPAPSPRRAGPAAEVAASQGMMIESLDPDLDCHRGAPDKTPSGGWPPWRPPASSPSPSPPGSWSASARRGPTGSTPSRPSPLPPPPRPRPGGDRPELPAQAGTAMHAPPCPADELAWTIAVARLILPPEVHVQAPAQPLRRPRPLLDAGHRRLGRRLAGHRRPRQPRAGLAGPRHPAPGHRGGRPHPGPPAHRLPRVRPRPRALARPGHALPRPRPLRRRGPGPRRPHAWCSGASRRRPPLLVGRRRRGTRRPSPWPPAWPAATPAGRRWRARCSPACSSARRWARTRSSPCSRPGAPRSRAVAEVADQLRRRGGGRRRHLGGQPQHQLHQRLHLQVPVLRLLQGPAVAQPARRALPARLSTTSPGGSRGRGGGAPPRSASRAASTRSSTATTTSTSSGRCGPPRPSTSTPSPPSR